MDGFDNDAYAAGYKQGCDEGRTLGYREGYNDHARSRAYAEAVYGPYTRKDETLYPLSVVTDMMREAYQKGRDDYIEEQFGLNDQS